MDELIKAGRITGYRKGEILIRPLDEPTNLHVVVSGITHSYSINKLGEKNIHLIYGPGEIFPLAWLVIERPLNIYYEAIIDSKVAKVKVDTVKRLLKSDTGISNSLLAQTIKQSILYKARVDNLEYRFARERIAYRLLLLGHRFGTLDGEVIVMPKFNQDEIANTANVSRESVNRELKRFEKLKYITLTAGKLKILNPKALRKEIGDDDTPLLIDDIQNM